MLRNGPRVVGMMQKLHHSSHPRLLQMLSDRPRAGGAETDAHQRFGDRRCPQGLHEGFLLVIAENQIDTLDLFDLGAVGDGVATDHYDLGIRVAADGPADRHARSLGRLAGNSAGVYDDDIRSLCPLGYLEPGPGEILGHRV
jgi:hypothetical protein